MSREWIVVGNTNIVIGDELHKVLRSIWPPPNFYPRSCDPAFLLVSIAWAASSGDIAAMAFSTRADEFVVEDDADPTGLLYIVSYTSGSDMITSTSSAPINLCITKSVNHTQNQSTGTGLRSKVMCKFIYIATLMCQIHTDYG
jgi:hypothetical protein